MTGADNQQERLVELGWIIGFVDGEGCFSLGVIRQPDRVNRRGYKTGYQVFPEFAVTQGARSVDVLHRLKEFFGIGEVYVNRRYDNHKEHMYRYTVRKLKDLNEVIIPFFRENHLRTAKRGDFDKFVQGTAMISAGQHLSHGGLAEVLEIMQTMNHQKSRTELIRILRDHTPEA